MFGAINKTFASEKVERSARGEKGRREEPKGKHKKIMKGKFINLPTKHF